MPTNTVRFAPGCFAKQCKNKMDMRGGNLLHFPALPFHRILVAILNSQYFQV